MKFKFFLATAAFLFAFSFAGSAQVKQRAVNQHHRIRQGVRSGEITAGERARIANKEKEVRQDVKDAKSDGVVTGQERREIRRDQNRASRTIYRTKHNNRTRN